MFDTLVLKTPYLALDKEFYDLAKIEPLDEPYLIDFNAKAGELIGLDTIKEDDFIALLNGTITPKGSTPFAMCYAGHQFGHYNPWLGDGRVSNLGKISKWNLQLKGSGETLYSRMADGKATVASSIREYLMSEAMHYLGIPTTRAVGIIGSTTQVMRNGMHNASIVLRLSTSWVRFGSFEYFYYKKDFKKLEALALYVIDESFPHLKNDEDKFFKLFEEIVNRTAILIAKWQGVGFTHGVMNTDNFSIEGLTLDYGPYAFLDDFNYNFICNASDKVGRYAYGEQPNISYWNLTKLAKTFSPMVAKERTQKLLDAYGESIYPNAYINVMRKKLGLFVEVEEDAELIEALVVMLHDAFVDYTLFFRTLSRYGGDKTELYDIAMNPVVVDNWLTLYDKRLEKEKQSQAQRQEKMLKENPKYVLKNYMLQEAIALAQKGDFSMVKTLLYIAQNPYSELEAFEHFFGDTPQEHKNVCLACSS